MRLEYAVQGIKGFRHWSSSYPTKALAMAAAKDLTGARPGRAVNILKRIPLPPGHEIGARWEIVAEFPNPVV